MSGMSDLTTEEYLLTTQVYSIPEPSSAISNCSILLVSYENETSYRFAHLTSLDIPEIIISVLVFLVNLIVVMALAKSWRKFQQNIYIFAFVIALWDTLLGLINLSNSIRHFMYENDVSTFGTHKTYRDETHWFYSVKAAIFTAAEVSTAGHTAMIAVAFYKYVTAQMPKQASSAIRKAASPGAQRKKSILISRKKSYAISLAICLVSIFMLCAGMIWNCTRVCSCFFRDGVLLRNSGSAACHYSNGCSFLFPSLDSTYAIIVATLFLTALVVVIVACARTVYYSGGCAAILPYKWHLKMVRKKRMKDNDEGDPKPEDIYRRKHSVQLSYLRSMTHFIFFVTIVYITCRLPANLLMIIDSTVGYQTVPLVVADAFEILGLVHSLLNPIVFYLTLHRMKQAIHSLFDFKCCRTVEVKRRPAINIDDDRRNQTKSSMKSSLNTLKSQGSMNKSVRISPDNMTVAPDFDNKQQPEHTVV
ncbi:unnamed protein product [Clavelina lepadiformis]|uniref:G-protein coupled receptors family 1 profile domain-containing protein n=1 Tax=Clavelina lepadiformis TaxID=159417 RepID=A0ABP0FWW8_CLALP